MNERKPDAIHPGLGILLVLICTLVSAGLVYVTFVHEEPAPARAAASRASVGEASPPPLPRVPFEMPDFAGAGADPERAAFGPMRDQLTVGDLMDEPFLVASDILNEAISGIDVSGTPGPGDAGEPFLDGGSGSPAIGGGVTPVYAGSSEVPVGSGPAPGWTSLLPDGSGSSGGGSGGSGGTGGSGGAGGSGGSGGSGDGGSGGGSGGSGGGPSVPTPEPSAPLLFAVGSLVAAGSMRRRAARL